MHVLLQQNLTFYSNDEFIDATEILAILAFNRRI